MTGEDMWQKHLQTNPCSHDYHVLLPTLDLSRVIMKIRSSASELIFVAMGQTT